MPLQRRLPKRGFNNIFAKQYTEVGWKRSPLRLRKAMSSMLLR